MACRFQSPTIVGWMPCFVANCAVVSSPRSASSANFALNSAEYRFRLLVIQVRPSQERTELKPLSEFAVPPHSADLSQTQGVTPEMLAYAITDETTILPRAFFWASGRAPSWAEDWGQDEHGPW